MHNQCASVSRKKRRGIERSEDDKLVIELIINKRFKEGFAFELLIVGVARIGEILFLRSEKEIE